MHTVILLLSNDSKKKIVIYYIFTEGRANVPIKRHYFGAPSPHPGLSAGCGWFKEMQIKTETQSVLSPTAEHCGEGSGYARLAHMRLRPLDSGRRMV